MRPLERDLVVATLAHEMHNGKHGNIDDKTFSLRYAIIAAARTLACFRCLEWPLKERAELEKEVTLFIEEEGGERTPMKSVEEYKGHAGTMFAGDP